MFYFFLNLINTQIDTKQRLKKNRSEFPPFKTYPKPDFDLSERKNNSIAAPARPGSLGGHQGGTAFFLPPRVSCVSSPICVAGTCGVSTVQLGPPGPTSLSSSSICPPTPEPKSWQLSWPFHVFLHKSLLSETSMFIFATLGTTKSTS